jgi:hypothetical protein
MQSITTTNSLMACMRDSAREPAGVDMVAHGINRVPALIERP